MNDLIPLSRVPATRRRALRWALILIKRRVARAWMRAGAVWWDFWSSW